jgi:hypothetical protein
MTIIRNIKWDFSDTEFSDCLYEEAMNLVFLPESLDIEELEEDSSSYEIKSYLHENYGFEVKSFELEE